MFSIVVCSMWAVPLRVDAQTVEAPVTSALPAIAMTAARGTTTALTLVAPANARCDLQPISPRGTRPLTAFSDSRGRVRYTLTLGADARGGALLTLDCRNAVARMVRGLSIAPGAATRPASVAKPPANAAIADLATTARFGVLPGTPAHFDVSVASDAQLAKFGYPPRDGP